MKKYILILIAILAIGGGVAYFMLVKTVEPTVFEKKEIELHVISQGISLNPINSFDNKAIWFGLSEGRLMRYDIDSQTASEYPLPRVFGGSFKKIYWPKNGNDFIASTVLDDLTAFNYFNYEMKQYVTLPSNVLEIDWLNDSRRIVIVWLTTEGKIQLVTSNADAGGYKVVRELPWEDLVPYASPVNNTALLIRSKPEGTTNKIYLFDLDNGKYEELVTTGMSTGVLWSSTGKEFVYTQTDGTTNRVYLYNILTGNSQLLDIETTIEKMHFSQDGTWLYAVLPSEGTSHQLVKYHLKQKTLETIFTSDKLNVSRLLVIGEKYYFINQTDRLLYGIE